MQINRYFPVIRPYGVPEAPPSNKFSINLVSTKSKNPNRMRSIGVFLFFVPKMCPKCDSLGATFVLNASQKGGA